MIYCTSGWINVCVLGNTVLSLVNACLPNCLIDQQLIMKWYCYSYAHSGCGVIAAVVLAVLFSSGPHVRLLYFPPATGPTLSMDTGLPYGLAVFTKEPQREIET